VVGAGVHRETWLLRSDEGPGAAMGVFKWSIYYLALLFVAVAADQLILG
jgi:heme O synthase-like polyprenyltransferase